MAPGVLTVEYQKSISVPVPGAVAAYSLNSKCAEASASDGIVTVIGVGTCDTWIVVVTDKGTPSMQVHVVTPPPNYPAGFIPPEQPGAALGTSHYEFRYVSSPGEIQNTFDSIQRQGAFTSHLHVSGLVPFSPAGTESAWSFPYLYYDLSSPRVGITLFDQLMSNSPLTVDNTVVRGLHVRFGRWNFHAGYSSVQAFQDVILPSQKEGIVGMGYILPVGHHASLTANLYAIRTPSKDVAGQSGQMATLVYEYSPSEHFDLLTELGYSRGPGGALRLISTKIGDHLIAHLRYEPARFAGLGLNNFHGFFGDLAWDHQWSNKISSSLDLSEQRYNLPQLRQTNIISRLQFEYRPTRQWTLLGGGGYSLFESSSGNFPKVNGLNFPIGISFDTLHFGSGFQYRYSHNSSIDRGGQEFRASLRGGVRRFSASVYFDRQTETPTLGFLLQQVPGLQEAMAELDLQATSPGDISRLFESNLTLQNLGVLNGLTINLSPVRRQWGADLTWTGNGSSHQQVRLSFMDERLETLDSTVGTTMGTITYSRQLGFDNAVTVSFSAFRTGLGGLPGTLHPLAEITFQHRFHSAPGLLMRIQRGIVGGEVFQDKSGTGAPGPGSRPLAGIQVVLDGTRRTRTDPHGRYQFNRIPYGLHTVEIDFKSKRPFFYTTPSRVQTDINAQVDFGITYAAGHLFGVVDNDAGAGLVKARVIVASARNRYEATTGDDGKFSVSGVESGSYRVSVDPNSLPAGYRLGGLKPVPVEVVAGTPAKTELTVEAIRSVSGRVRWFDRRAGTFVPVPGAEVRIKSLHAESTTDAQGRYLFRQLGAGTYQVETEINGKEYSRQATLTADPILLRHIDFDLTAVETPSTLALQREKQPLPTAPGQTQP